MDNARKRAAKKHLSQIEDYCNAVRDAISNGEPQIVAEAGLMIEIEGTWLQDFSKEMEEG